jgi:hypothetical protein
MPVAPDAEKLVAEASKLPAEERVEAVDRLLKTLDDADRDALDNEDRERLHAAIGRSQEPSRSGQVVSAKTVLDALRKKL